MIQSLLCDEEESDQWIDGCRVEFANAPNRRHVPCAGKQHTNPEKRTGDGVTTTRPSLASPFFEYARRSSVTLCVFDLRLFASNKLS